jgi:predicted RNase H-like HicB family nuclease
MPERTSSVVLHKEGNLYVAECPEVGTVSQGETVEDAISNLREATELYLEEMESIRAYDKAKASGDEVIPFEQAPQEINRRGIE